MPKLPDPWAKPKHKEGLESQRKAPEKEVNAVFKCNELLQFSNEVDDTIIIYDNYI